MFSKQGMVSGPREPEIAGFVRLRVQRTLIALANGAELGDEKKVRAQFAEEVEIDLTETLPPYRLDSAKLVEESRGRATAFGFSAAAASLPEIEVRGDFARAISYGHSFHVQPAGADQNLWLLYCRYEHELRYTPQGWRVTGIRVRPVTAGTRAGDRRLRAKAVPRALNP